MTTELLLPADAGPLQRGVSALVPKLAKRGYAAVGLHMPKTPSNVGSVLRAAHCYGVAMVAQTGKRYHGASTDTMKAYRHLPLLNVDDLFAVVPHDCVPVAVDLLDDARSLVNYRHPERAFYIFGPEDGTLGKTGALDELKSSKLNGAWLMTLRGLLVFTALDQGKPDAEHAQHDRQLAGRGGPQIGKGVGIIGKPLIFVAHYYR